MSRLTSTGCLLIAASLLATACATKPIERVEPQHETLEITATVSSPTQLATSAPENELATTNSPLNNDKANEVPSDYEEGLVWQRIRAGFKLPATYDQPLVQKYLSWHQCHTAYLQRVSWRAEPYLHFIIEEIEDRGMPSELALLPVVESAYIPFAYSHGRAAGLWQFIPGTGRLYGLKQNWWYDGRRDVYASTKAALNYLSDLNERFEGDWLLSLAAYNAGPLRVLRAIEKNKKRGKPTDYWHLDLPRETRNYIPKLLAVKAIVESPQWSAIALWPVADEPVIASIGTQSQIDLALAAELSEISIEEMYQLNPGFNRWATDPDGPHRLLLPKDKLAIFERNLAQLPPERRITWIRHRIRKGQTLSHIARKHNITVAYLKQTNNLRSNRIRAGKYLLIPKAQHDMSSYTLSSDERHKRKLAQRKKGYRHDHIVAGGESFWSISRKYGVTVRKLANWNGKAPGDILKPGEKLVVWGSQSNYGARPNSSYLHKAAHGQKIKKVRYKVRRGDSLYRIAKRFNVNVADLRKWNKLPRNNLLHPGQRLTVYVDITKQSSNI